MKNRILGFAALCGAAGAACGQVTPNGPFTGDLQEGFQTRQNWSVCVFCTSVDIFPGDIATGTAPDGSANMHVTGGWGFFCSIGQHNTPNIFASAGGGGVDWTFDPGSEPGKFGGWFGTNSGTPDAVAEFYDPNGGLVTSLAMAIPADCTWNWHGWDFTVPIRKIRIIGNNPFQGGYIQHDDLEWSPSAPACPCACNYDTSTGVDVCDVFDFLEFQNAYAANDPCACNEDTSTGQNNCDVFDFLEFQNGYAAGCP